MYSGQCRARVLQEPLGYPLLHLRTGYPVDDGRLDLRDQLYRAENAAHVKIFRSALTPCTVSMCAVSSRSNALSGTLRVK